MNASSPDRHLALVVDTGFDRPSPGRGQSTTSSCLQSCWGGGARKKRPPPFPSGSAKNSKRKNKTQADQDGDALLTRETTELSSDEREKVYDDIHGIPNVVDEDEDLVNQSLKAMDEEIGKIQKKSAYERAFFLSAKYVKDQNFRLLFLRAELFNVQKAAARFVKHFEGKLELFGLGKLVKDIELKDLNKDDITFLKAGTMQVLSQTDRSGRPIMLYVQRTKSASATWSAKLKVFWYLVMSRLQADEESQKKGFVSVVDNTGNLNESDKNGDFFVMRKSAVYFACLPVRFGCTHYCVSGDEERSQAYVSLAKIIVGYYNRLRFRVHFGSMLEVFYEMATFGIPRDTIPIDNEGNLNNQASFLLYLDSQASLEADRRKNRAVATEGRAIEYPTETDVLLGRGRPFHVYTGNVKLANLIGQRQVLYETAEKGEKWVIAAGIVKSTKAAGGRFLKRTIAAGSESWIEVGDDKAREKVAQSFRAVKAGKRDRSSIASSYAEMMTWPTTLNVDEE